MKKILLVILVFVNLFGMGWKKIILYNDTPFKLVILIGYFDGEEWISKGWYYIKSHKELTFYTKSRVFYYRAKSYYGNYNWYPSNGESYRRLYVDPYKAFKIKSSNPPSNAKLEKFKKVITPNDLESYKLSFTYTKNDVFFENPQDCICYKDYISITKSINPLGKKPDANTAERIADALSVLPASDYCSNQATRVILMASQSYGLLAKYQDECGESTVDSFFIGFFEPWKAFTTCPDIMKKGKKLAIKFDREILLYEEWYQGNCTR
jgi:hypothetical protein